MTYDTAVSMNDERSDTPERLAIGLGLFSIGLGMAELMAPRALSRAIGMPDASSRVLRGFGAREIGAGLSILSQPDRAAWLWSRVGGDALDLSYLASGLTHDESNRTRLATVMAAVAGVTALDIVTARQLQKTGRRPAAERAVRVEQVVTVNRNIHDVYAFWKDFENFPRFMRHLDSVERIDERHSRWRAKAPAGMKVEWKAETLEDRADEWIAWRSLPGSRIENSGSVRFSPAPGARGTEVRVQLQYTPPGGALGRGLAWLFGEEPDIQVKDDLRRFKQLMETGEIPISEGPALWRAAQPASPEKLRKLAGVRS